MPSRDCAHYDRSTVNVEADRIAGAGHHARYLHSVAEAGSIVLHVSNNGEDGEDGEEVGETAAAKETEKMSKKTWKSEDSSRRGEVHPKKRNND